MGVTGAGKSSFISLLCKEKIEIGHDLESCTKDVAIYACYSYPDTVIYFIDTPGFDDTNRSDTEVLRELATWFAKSYSNDIKLNGILYFHRISDVRMQGSAKKNLMMFKKLCGQDALKNVVLVMSMWDRIPHDDAVKREEQLKQTPEFWGWMMSKGSQIFRHDNTLTSAETLLEHFCPAMKKKVILDLQQEMVDQRKTLDETKAGKELNIEIAKERERFERELKETREEMFEAIKQRDQESVQVIKEMQDEYQTKLTQLEKQQAELKVAMEKLHLERYEQLEAKLQAYQRDLERREELERTSRNPTPVPRDLASPRDNTPYTAPRNHTADYSTPAAPTAYFPHVPFETAAGELVRGLDMDEIKRASGPVRSVFASFPWKSGQPGNIASLSFSPDGAMLACGFDRGGIRVLNTMSWSTVADLVLRERSDLGLVRFSPDSNMLAAFTTRKSYLNDSISETIIVMWQVLAAKSVQSVRWRDAVVDGALLSGDRLIAYTKVGPWDNGVVVWNTVTGALLLTLRLTSREASGPVCFAPNGTLAGVYDDEDSETSAAWIWNIADIDADSRTLHTVGLSDLWRNPTGRLIMSKLVPSKKIPLGESWRRHHGQILSPNGEVLVGLRRAGLDTRALTPFMCNTSGSPVAYDFNLMHRSAQPDNYLMSVSSKSSLLMVFSKHNRMLGVWDTKTRTKHYRQEVGLRQGDRWVSDDDTGPDILAVAPHGDLVAVVTNYQLYVYRVNEW